MKHEITTAMVRNILESSIEDTSTAEAIRAFLVKHDGKKLTKREETKMRAQINGSIRTRPGYLSGFRIEWQEEPGEGHTKSFEVPTFLNMGATEIYGGVEVNSFDRRNAAYLDAAKTRNERRRLALKDEASIRQVAYYMNVKAEAEAKIEALLEYDTPLGVDGFAIRKLADG